VQERRPHRRLRRVGERLASSVGHLGFLARELGPEIPRALAEIGS